MYLEHCRVTKDFHSDGSIVVTDIPMWQEGKMREETELPPH